MNNDLISRRVLKGLIRDKSIPIKFEEEKRGNWQSSLGVILSDIYNVIDNAPTVEAYTKDDMTREYLKGYNACKDMNERPQGEWERLTKIRCKCSKCGFAFDDFGILFNFCPNCGAKMKGGES